MLTLHCEKCGTEMHPDEMPDYEFTSECKVRYTQPCALCGGVIKAGPNLRPIFNDNMAHEYGTTHWSEAMAIGVSQIEAHKKLFPDVPVREDGVVGFNSVQQQEKYMTACGFVKHPQKLRPIATR